MSASSRRPPAADRNGSDASTRTSSPTVLVGGRVQDTILADIIRRAAARAGIEKHVKAHTLRHTAATWLRQERGDTRLVAEYLGHADLSTVARYAHVDREELFDAAGRLEQLAAPSEERAAPDAPAEPGGSQDLSSGSDRPRRRRRRHRWRRRRRFRGRPASLTLDGVT